VQVSGDNPPGSFRMLASLLLLQAVNHGTEHRSHVPTILTQLVPATRDGWLDLIPPTKGPSIGSRIASQAVVDRFRQVTV